jgi:hypothetical protein
MSRIRRAVTLTFVALLATTPASALKFVALPDTQIYSEDRLPGSHDGPPVTDPAGTYRYFVDQTQWIVDNAERLGIDYVVHLGDIIDNDDVSVEWVRAKAAMDILHDAGVPYGTVIGNHDAHSRSSGRPYYETYVENFGPQRFQGRPWFGGASPTGASNYQVVGDAHHDVLFLNLAIAAPADELAWADEVLRQHRDKLVVLTTHAYMWDVFAAYGRYGEPAGGLASVAGDGSFDGIHGGQGKTAQEIYLELIRSHPNVVMAQGGHFDADLYRLDGRNGADLPVLEIVSDYQSLRNGGDGYLRIYDFDFPNDRIVVETYSPTLDRTRTTLEHFVNAVWLVYEFRDEVAEALDLTPEQAFAILASILKVDTVPGVDVVTAHPDYQREPAYYEQLLVDQFRGDVPPEIGELADWEGLWMGYFAADPADHTDNGSSIRSPDFTIALDFDRYVTGDRVVTDAQRTCIVGMAHQLAGRRGVLGQRSAHHERCLRDAKHGGFAGTTVDVCLARDPGGRLAQALATTRRFEAQRCTSSHQTPEFGFSGAAVLSQVAKAQSLGMTADLFGPTPIALAPASTDPRAYRCQVGVAGRTNALFETMLREALAHAKRSLAEGTRNVADLTVGMLETIDADREGAVARFRDALHARIARHCHGAGVVGPERFPGACKDVADDAEELTSCLERRARCRTCETLNAVHGSAVACDVFDDGESLNLSCP